MNNLFFYSIGRYIYLPKYFAPLQNVCFAYIIVFAALFTNSCGEKKTRDEVMDKEVKEYRAFYQTMKNYRVAPFDSTLLQTEHHLLLHPDDAVAHAFYGRLQYDAGNLDKALGGYKKAIQYNARYTMGYLGAGSIHNIKNELDSAEFFLQKALANGDTSAYGYLGLAFVNMKKNQAVEALAYADSALIRNDSQPMVYSGLCLVAHRFAKKELAATLYQKAVESGMTDTVFFNEVLKEKISIDSFYRKNGY